MPFVAATDGGIFLAGSLADPELVVYRLSGANATPQAAIVPVDRIRNFLEANYVAPSSSKPGIEETKASVTRVICVRK